MKAGIRILGLAIGLAATVPASAALVIASGTPGTTGSSGLYATVLAANTTGIADSAFLGVPNDNFNTPLAGRFVTYDFEDFRIIDGAGQDINLYELDSGSPELTNLGVAVSSDNITFISIFASRQALGPDIAGDELFTRNNNLQSFDLGAATLAGLTDIRYLRVTFNSAYDPDAVGIVNFRAAEVANAVPEPATWAMLLMGFGFVGQSLRRRQQQLSLNA